MEFQIERKKDHIAIVKLDGRLVGEFQTIRLNDQIAELLDDNYNRIVFDMSELEYINSSGLNFFLKILTRVRKSDGEVALCSLNKLLLDLLVTTKLNLFFTICHDCEEAVEHLVKEKSVK